MKKVKFIRNEGNTKLESFLKRVVALCLTLIVILWTLGNVVSSGLLHAKYEVATGNALNSPVLNNTFAEEDWNKWEMVCWGVFLSNFCQPGVDTYESAFNTDASYGSTGKGYQALVFGTGSDATNNETIQKLVNFALDTRKSSSGTPIYLAADANGNKSKLDENGKPVEVSMSSYDTAQTYTKATINDLFISDGLREPIFVGTTYKRDIVKKCTLNKFYIQNGSTFYEVWNNLNSWDIQVLGATFGKMATSDYLDEATKNINWAFKNKAELVWDCFGNICFKNESGELIVLVQAANNQHITNDNKINLVTSMVMNSSANSSVAYTKQSLLDYAGQDVYNSKLGTSIADFFGTGETYKNNGEGGNNAVGGDINSGLNGKCVLYYDTDTVIAQGDTASLQYSDALGTLFALDMNKETGNAYTLKMSPLGGDELINKLPKNDDNKLGMKFVLYTYNSASTIADQCNTVKNVETMTSYNNLNDQKISLIGEPVYIPVQTQPAIKDGDKTSSYIPRQFMNYLGNRYNGIGGSGTTSGLSLKEVQALVKSGYVGSVTTEGISGLAKEIFTYKIVMDKAYKASPLYMDFINANKTSYYTVSGKANLEDQTFVFDTGLGDLLQVKNDKTIMDMMATYKLTGSAGTKISVKKEIATDANLKGTYPGRVIKAYAQSSEMIGMSNVLNVTNGTDFSVYSSMIYITYLNWYGLDQTTTPTGDKEFTSDFKEPLFDWCKGVLPESIEDIADTMSNDDLEKEIIKYSYLSLNPESKEAREYREQMQMQGIEDLLYDQYSKICYGGSGTSGINSKSDAGFLKVHTYDENMFTGFFIRGYSDIAIWLIGLLAISIVIMGLLKNKKFSWFIITLIVTINALLVVPSYGEITPYVANKAVQDIFKDKMTFWSLSEQIADIERQSEFTKNNNNSYLSSLTDVEKNTIMTTIDSLDSIQLDRALMVKQDISSKVVYSNSDALNKAQQYQSARWLLPLIMQQYSDEDSEAKYVYKSLGDKIEDASNCYWYFNPNAANSVNTISAKSDFVQSPYTEGTNTVKMNLMANHNGHSSLDTDKNVTYRNIAYTRPNATVSMSDKYNTFYYLLDGNYEIGQYKTEYNGFQTDEDLLAYINDNDSPVNATGFEKASNIMQEDAVKYIANDRETYAGTLPYLQATETPLEYFYMAVSNCFSTDASYAYMVGQLQGDFDTITEMTEDGKPVDKEIRTGMCYESGTGYVVDVLDLEHMFKDMIPYMYGMQLMAGGVDGNGGYLGKKEIVDYEVYKGTSQAWLFRSNWVTKIIDNPEYCDSTMIGLGDGKTAEIQNQALPQEYEAAGREMVFSEAQQHSLGLKNKDLSLLELKLVKINKQVAKKWTMLLNYVGVTGMNKEVLIRQMAIDGMTEFNSGITSTSIFNTNYQMFPNSLDLRSISFDSVMKMLVLNVTKDTTYIYGDTMKLLIQDSDLGTAALLLICSWLCCYIVPLSRDIMLAILLYGAVMSIIYNIFGGNNQKMRVSVGSLVSAVVVTIGTVIYYKLFSLLVRITSSEEVLSTSSVSVQAGNPIWLFLAIIGMSLVYIAGVTYMSIWCMKNFKDAGKSVYTEVQRNVADGFKNGMNRLRGKMSDVGDGIGHIGSSMSNIWDKEYSTEVESAEEKRSRTKTKKESVKSGNTEEDISAIDNYDEQFKKKSKDSESLNESIEKVEKEVQSIDSEIEKGLKK